MESLNISGLKRKPEVIAKHFKAVGDATVVTSNLRIIFPERYVARGLAVMGSHVRLLSVYAVLDDDNNYGIVNIPIFINITPTNISEIDIEGKLHVVCHFEKDNIFTTNNTLVIEDDFLYDLFDEFMIQGNIPWYIEYDDIANILHESEKYVARDIGSNPVAMEILASIISKSPEDSKLYYRQSKKVNVRPKYLGLSKSYVYGDSTISKVVGNYYSVGVTSAILNKETETTDIEEILRA